MGAAPSPGVSEFDALGRAVAEIDADTIRANCAVLVGRLRAGAELCAVVKADGYGHGAATAAAAALAGGATRLAVAAAVEASQVAPRFPTVRMLTLGALSTAELEQVLAVGSEVAVWQEGFLGLLASRARALGRKVPVHVKFDSGMGRLGCRDPAAAVRLARATAADPDLELAGIWTHLATADEPANPFFAQQLRAFSAVATAVKSEYPSVTIHAANSAAVLRGGEAHFDMARCGLAIYGLDPFHRDPSDHGLTPALRLRSYLAQVKRLDAGESVGYGRTWRAAAETHIGVVPIGYGDGVRRGLSNRCAALVGGRRVPVVGTISMDNLTVDLGPHPSGADTGAEVVLIGSQGEETILAEELATQIGTINHEVVCGIAGRVSRRVAG